MFDKIVVLTGAGLSNESGVDTFRDADGIWSKIRLEDVATREGFSCDPGRVHAFYNARRAGSRTVRPNAAHLALAELEARRPGSVLIVTQNIDALHEAAGSRNLIHMHGAIDSQLCAHCGDRRTVTGDLSFETVCPT